MTLASALKYTLNQCTEWVAESLSWIPAGLGNAAQWAQNAHNLGYPIASVPVVGSVAVWAANRGGALDAGHVAVVVGVQPSGLPVVSEQNWTSGATPDTRNVTAQSAAGIIGYILPKGSPAAPVGNPTVMPVDLTLKSGDQSVTLPFLGSDKSLTIPSAGDIVAPLGAAFAVGLNAVLAAIGHGIANLVSLSAGGLYRGASSNIVALATAAVVVLVMFH